MKAGQPQEPVLPAFTRNTHLHSVHRTAPGDTWGHVTKKLEFLPSSH